MEIKAGALLKGMFMAARGEIEDDLPGLEDMLKTELKSIAESVVLIEKLLLHKRISKKQARLLIEMKQINARAIILTVEGIGVVLAERAINAAIKSVKDTVNTALDFRLL